jgi:hypothetical protein
MLPESPGPRYSGSASGKVQQRDRVTAPVVEAARESLVIGTA